MITLELIKRVTEIKGANYILHVDGKVFSKHDGNEIRQRLNEDGYKVFTAGTNNKRANVRTHRIIAETFIPNPNNLPEVDHLDNDRANASVYNLGWCTRQENIKRSYERGSHKDRAVGSKNPRARLSEADVIEMRRLYDNQIMTQQQIAKKYNVGWSTVHNAVFRFTWNHIK